MIGAYGEVLKAVTAPLVPLKRAVLRNDPRSQRSHKEEMIFPRKKAPMRNDQYRYWQLPEFC